MLSGRPLRASTLRRLINLWPPFLCNGIRVLELANDWSRATVRLGLHFWNRNYVGTQFGGNLFSMTDPWWMLLTMHRLGRRYLVWDKAAAIDFVAPGKADVFAHFVLEEHVLDELRAAAADGSKVLRWFEVDVKTADGTVVARVRKQLYVRLKPSERPGEAVAAVSGDAVSASAVSGDAVSGDALSASARPNPADAESS